MTVWAERSQKNDGDNLVDNCSYSNVTHRIHVWYIYLHSVDFLVNGGKYTIHCSYGSCRLWKRKMIVSKHVNIHTRCSSEGSCTHKVRRCWASVQWESSYVHTEVPMFGGVSRTTSHKQKQIQLPNTLWRDESANPEMLQDSKSFSATFTTADNSRRTPRYVMVLQD